MFEMPEPRTLYKYLSPQGAIKTLTGRSIKFSTAKSFNDPFDMEIEEVYGSDFESFEKGINPAFIEFLAGEIPYEKLRPSDMKDMVIQMNQAFRAAAPEQREELMKLSIEELGWEDGAETLKNHSIEILDRLKSDFVRWGIFCASTSKSNLLMWSHYAQNHEGAVFELYPDIPSDSVLRVARPVEYEEIRPLIYRTPKDYIHSSFLKTLEKEVEDIFRGILFTKSRDWKYEEECRIAIPDLIEPPNAFALLNLKPSELISIYLGSKITTENEKTMIEAAKLHYPKTKIFRTVRDRREYFLHWEKITI